MAKQQPRQTTIDRKMDAYKYFCKLYDIERLRFEDSIEKAAKKFYYEINSMEDIVKRKGEHRVHTKN